MYPQDVAGRGCSKPQQFPPPRHGRRLFLALIAAALAPSAFGVLPARADLCLELDPLVAIGCSRHEPASGPRGSAAAPSSEQGFLLSPTTIEYDPRRIAVTVDDRASRRQIAAAFADAGVELEQAVRQIDAYLVLVEPERQAAAVRALRSSPVVVRAGPEVVSHVLDTTPNDSEWPLQVGLRVVGLPRAWDTSRGSAALVVAVVDTGVDANQPDLRGALVPGLNLIDHAALPRDDHGHGTAVAGVVAARANNGQGMAGVCWFCLIMPVKVLDSSGSGDDTRIAAGIVWAADHGARVINLSLGGPGSTPELEAALAYASHKGATVVAAAGNTGTTIPFYPAADINALSVAATTTADRAYPWSNYGSWVDVAAPGCNVAPALTGGYALFCGTSSAAPIVSGLAALVLSAHSGATPTEIRDAIERSGSPLPGIVRFGRVDAPHALAALARLTAPSTRVEQGSLSKTHQARSYDVQSAAGPLNATVRFRAGARLTVTFDSLESGVRLGQRAGHAPLRFSQPVPGPVRVTVRALSGLRMHFVLTLSFERTSE
jgi:subtilisin family serine protease